MFNIRKSAKKTATRKDDNPSKNNEAFQTGLSIAKLLTSYWNSQKDPGKAYIFNRRVHHGEIGSLLGFSNLFKKSQPLPSGILSGLGEGLAKDDYGDVKEWFTFKKKDTAAEPSTTTESTHSAPDRMEEKG
ncbi:MAG: hypothetical protein M3044_05530 [Thermoproteota archaeon]|nr:hypothetical protein [Thermoproteota archaeon]